MVVQSYTLFSRKGYEKERLIMMNPIYPAPIARSRIIHTITKQKWEEQIPESEKEIIKKEKEKKGIELP